MSKYKKVHKAFFAWEYEKEEAFINQQSEEGWQLIHGGCFSSTYENAPDQRHITRVDFNPVILKDSEEKKRYIQVFEDMGWEYLNTTFNGWSFFRKPYSPEVPEEEYRIYSDQESLSQMFQRLSRLLSILQTVLFVILVYFAAQMISGHFTPIWLYMIDVILYVVLILAIGRGQKQIKQRLCQDSK